MATSGLHAFCIVQISRLKDGGQIASLAVLALVGCISVSGLVNISVITGC